MLRWLFRGVALVLAVGVLYLAVTFVQVWSASRQDERPAADAVVVLGAAQYDGRPSPVLAERLDHAAELWTDGVAPIIVVTGGSQAGDRTNEGLTSYHYLRELGVPDEAIKVEVQGTDTYEELSATANILDEAGAGDVVVLVSDPYHALRATTIASEVGLDAVMSPTEGGASPGELARETAAVALGRIISFRRLSNLQ